jgi:heat shock protein HslJ
MYSRIPLYTFILTASLMLSGCGEGQQVSEPAAEPVALEGTSWQLVKITAIGGYEFVPEDASDYLLRFRAESRMVVESDCNTAGATWSQEDNNLILEQFVTTNNMCPPGTLHNHFVSNLRNIESFTGDASNLVFTTSIPGVTLEFEIRGSGSSQQR